MRPVAFLFVSLFATLLPACASSLPSAPVTVLLRFEQDHSTASLDEMQHELEILFKKTGYRFAWKQVDQIGSSESFDDLVVVKMKGRCAMEPEPLVYDERGPLAFTHSADGQVLPFSEVECDKVRRSVERALAGNDRAHTEQVYGRALGRVLAHELYHIFAKTCHHGQEGVAKTSLSGKALVSNRLQFAPSELHELAHFRRDRP